MTPRPLEEVVRELIKIWDSDLCSNAFKKCRCNLLKELRASLAEREKKIETDKNHCWHNGVMICLCPDEKHAWVNNPQFLKAGNT